ncbi:MAG: PEGA domain-containing protein [Kofleriaceae bacterium]
MLARVVVAAILVAASPAFADRVVALAPLSTLGAEDTSASTRKLTGQIEAALAALPGTRVVSAAKVADAIKRSKKPELKTCERNPSCLSDIGKLVGANVVIDGEVGGLGDSKVVYLGATDVGTARELRSTTLSVGAGSDGGAPAAVVRLLDPDRYRGTVRFAIDVSGATIYVNGTKASLSKTRELSLGVGTQAVRVTHPEYHDFVRFIDVSYGKTSDVQVSMKQYPIIQHDLQGRPINRDREVLVDPPLWRRWYVVVPSAVALAIISGVIVGALVHDFPDGECRKVGGEPC